ncbi:DUF3558 domain-containing protein [Streptomyces sp. GMY02]|uniref:DUF3558 domain-containing protein n=1 Tax=Streptomyces sp. GMY02 TaxID=1333528 RepID=UPI001C2BE559|nr:DUF3558 domain-containing protein [Streptomyces sp. GMY02]QXE34587.1 DUF3558 domain-containing protein [Streptomyces sp. GMY02]
MKRSSLAAACLVLLLVPTVAACGSDTATDTRTPGDQASRPSASREPDAADAASDAKVDACTLLKPAEITPVIGKNDGGRPDGGVGESVCLWENPDTYHSVTLSIGSPGTAVPGQSDSGADGPDGISFGSGNMAEFVVDDRACTLQVVTSVTDESDRPTAEKLIGLVRTRL